MPQKLQLGLSLTFWFLAALMPVAFVAYSFLIFWPEIGKAVGTLCGGMGCTMIGPPDWVTPIELILLISTVLACCFYPSHPLFSSTAKIPGKWQWVTVLLITDWGLLAVFFSSMFYPVQAIWLWPNFAGLSSLLMLIYFFKHIKPLEGSYYLGLESKEGA